MKYIDRYSTSHLNRLKEITNIQIGIISNSIHLLASACYPFPSVLQALSEPSFVLPAEGMPKSRYLPGSKVMDVVELESEKLLLELIGARHEDYCASIQPHSGTQANQVVFNSVLKDGDLVLCVTAKDGGHISHTVLIGRRNKTLNLAVLQNGNIDYDYMEKLTKENMPKLIIIGGSSLPRQIDFGRCANIARKYGALLHADISHTATFIAAGLHKSCFPYCDFATFNMVKNLRGPNGGVIIYKTEYKKVVEQAIFPGTQGGANESTMLAKYATLLEWKNRSIVNYANSIINCSNVIVENLKSKGLNIVTGGTDCHIVLLDLSDREQSGAFYEKEFEKLNILINKNMVPNDPRGPQKTSGIRLGTTNLAILNYTDGDLYLLSNVIFDVIEGRGPSLDIISYLTSKYRWDSNQDG